MSDFCRLFKRIKKKSLIFVPLSFKKCNKLDGYIYTYFFIIPIISLNNFFYNKHCCWCHKKNRLYFFVILLVLLK